MIRIYFFERIKRLHSYLIKSDRKNLKCQTSSYNDGSVNEP